MLTQAQIHVHGHRVSCKCRMKKITTTCKVLLAWGFIGGEDSPRLYEGDMGRCF